jgi:YHS domain-containing protein
MKTLKPLIISVLLAAFAAAPLASRAADADAKTGKDAKPYPLKTCVVSGETLGEMGKPYVFTHEGREVQLCCKNCLKDFNKEPAKYLKKLDDAEADAKGKK